VAFLYEVQSIVPNDVVFESFLHSRMIIDQSISDVNLLQTRSWLKSSKLITVTSIVERFKACLSIALVKHRQFVVQVLRHPCSRHHFQYHVCLIWLLTTKANGPATAVGEDGALGVHSSLQVPAFLFRKLPQYLLLFLFIAVSYFVCLLL